MAHASAHLPPQENAGSYGVQYHRSMPGSIEAQNELAIIIFTIPKGTMGQDLFIDPLYRTLRNLIAKKCQCELAVFDGNTLTQRCVSSPRTAANRIRNANGNASIGPEVSCESASLLLAISNTYEQLLLARGTWLVQVNYLTEPSQHHLFLKLVDDFSAKIHNFGGFKRNIGSALLSQGFKRTTLVALTHDRLRQICRRDVQLSRESFDSHEESIKKLTIDKDAFLQHTPKSRSKRQHLSGDWGEFSTNIDVEINNPDAPHFQDEVDSEVANMKTVGSLEEQGYVDSLRRKFDAHLLGNEEADISDDEGRGLSVASESLEISAIGNSPRDWHEEEGEPGESVVENEEFSLDEAEDEGKTSGRREEEEQLR